MRLMPWVKLGLTLRFWFKIQTSNSELIGITVKTLLPLGGKNIT